MHQQPKWWRSYGEREARRIVNGVHHMRGPLLPAGRRRPVPSSLLQWTGIHLIVAAHEVEERYARNIERAGISLRDYVLLAEVVRIPGLSQSGLARRLGLSRSRVSEQLAGLDTAGYLYRDMDIRDLRLRRLWAGPAGSQIVAEVEHLLAAVEQSWLRPLSPGEQVLLKAFLRRLPPNVHEIAAGAPSDAVT
ncbi:MAG: hypothetical protein QOF37_991 [Thermoleophilaceae bacterium]|jgi:DNA-binding MarR family transcriptional regulator|nr:hypothetical protein [Thermoleophilaceae bacterium]